MTWVKIDDRYATHRKLLRAGPLAIALDVAGMCYCAGHGTDGFVPTEALAAAAPFMSKRQLSQALDALAAAGRWKPAEGGWFIHDYLTYNPSAAEAAKERWRRAENTRKWRQRQSGDRSPHDGGDDAVIPARPLGVRRSLKAASSNPPGRDPSPDPPDTSPPTVPEGADDDVPEPPTQPNGVTPVSMADWRDAVGIRAVPDSPPPRSREEQLAALEASMADDPPDEPTP